MSGHDGDHRDFYLRQLHDWKGAADVEEMVPTGAKLYARLCGETLARTHARSGDHVAIAAYLGDSARFDEAIAEFASSYADQNQRDYDAFVAAVASARLEAAAASREPAADLQRIVRELLHFVHPRCPCFAIRLA